jgi:hypothetical protein
MAQWWNNLVTGLGQQNAPFGFAPGTDPYKAGMQQIGNIGAGMLANSTSNPLEAFGRGYLGSQEIAQQNSKEAFAAKQMMDQAEEKRLERQAQAEQQAMMEAEISKLPPEEQAYARMMPDKYFGAQIDQKFATRGTPEFGLAPVALEDKDGNFAGYGQMSKAGGLFYNGQDVTKSGLRPVDPYGLNFDKASGAARGKVVGAAEGGVPAAILDAQATDAKIESLLNNPNIDDAIGYGSYLGDAFTSNEVIDVRGRVKELLGGAFLSAYSSLKGGGQITEVEGQKAQEAIQRMEQAMRSSDPETFKQALRDFQSAVRLGVQKLQATAGQPVTGGVPSAVPVPQGNGGTTSTGVPWSVE